MAPYNARNTDDPLDIDYRIEDRVKDHFDEISVPQTQLNETYADRSYVENTINVCKQGDLGRERARDRATTKAHMFLSLRLRFIIAITNYGQGSDPSSPNLAI